MVIVLIKIIVMVIIIILVTIVVIVIVTYVRRLWDPRKQRKTPETASHHQAATAALLPGVGFRVWGLGFRVFEPKAKSRSPQP